MYVEGCITVVEKIETEATVNAAKQRFVDYY